MEKLELAENENCFICSEFMGPFKNELTVSTGYSEKPIFEILELFTEIKFDRTMLDTTGVCQNCFIKFNEYDEHQTLANMIRKDLIEMHRTSTNYKAPKPDVKLEAEDYLLEYYDNVVEVVDGLYLQDVKKKLNPKKSLFAPYETSFIRADTTVQKDRSPRKLNLLKDSSRGRSSDKDAGLLVYNVDGVKYYQCDFCKKDFPSRSRLKTHRQIHTSERNFMCQSCGSSFKTLNCLKNHSRLHNNIFYNCDLCSSRFKGKHELRCHMDAIHLGRKDHICQICGKAFSRDKTLRQHLMYHVNDRNITCEVCGFKTVNKPKMTRHMKSHTGERNYECKLCGKRFLYSYNVTAHVKHVHYHEKRPTTSEDKLICSICGKKFQKIWKVRDHMKEVHKIIEAMEESLEITALEVN